MKTEFVEVTICVVTPLNKFLNLPSWLEGMFLRVVIVYELYELYTER